MITKIRISGDGGVTWRNVPFEPYAERVMLQIYGVDGKELKSDFEAGYKAGWEARAQLDPTDYMEPQ